MRIGVDAMGGDCAPGEVVRGVLAARQFLREDDRIVLVGREEMIRPHLGGSPDRVEIVHAPQTITMDEAPVEALRLKGESSIAVMARMQAEGRLDAFISAIELSPLRRSASTGASSIVMV